MFAWLCVSKCWRRTAGFFLPRLATDCTSSGDRSSQGPCPTHSAAEGLLLMSQVADRRSAVCSCAVNPAAR